MNTRAQSSHPFAEYIRILGRGKHGSRSLTQDEARAAMTMIMENKVEPVQLGAFLMLLRVKEETPEEIAGFVQAVKRTLHQSTAADAIDLDWSSYAGKRRQLPWYVLSARLLAEHGYKILMHGAAGDSHDRVYTESVFTMLGLPVAKSLADAQTLLNDHNLVYLSLQLLSPTLYEVMSLREVLGLRSPVHTVARLLNPLNSSHSVQAIFHPGYLAIHQQANALLGYQDSIVFKGEGGEIEINPDMETPIFRLRHSTPTEIKWPPYFRGFRHPKETAMDISLLLTVWNGELDHTYGIAAITETTAVCATLLKPELSFEGARSFAQNLWKSRQIN